MKGVDRASEAFVRPAALAGYNRGRTGPVVGFWAVATAALSVGGLVARPRHPSLVRHVALGGAAVVAGTGLLGALGLAVGLLPRYEPPAIGAAALPGTWGDHRGGSLLFTSDGRVTASGVGRPAPGDHPDDPSRPCTGSGTWTYDPGQGVRTEEVRIHVPGCDWAAWKIGGMDREPRIHQHIGPPDSGKRYELRKAADGP